MAGEYTQKYCYISGLQFAILEALQGDSKNRRDLEFQLNIIARSLVRAIDSLVDYGFIAAMPVNESAAPHRGRRLIRYQLTQLGIEMLAVLKRTNPH